MLRYLLPGRLFACNSAGTARNAKDPASTLAFEIPERDPPSLTQSDNFYSAATLDEIDRKMKNAVVRREIIAEAEKLYCGEIFRFLAAMVEWEAITDNTQRMLAAYKIIATFVETGSRYENNVSDRTRKTLLAFKSQSNSSNARRPGRRRGHVSATLFEAAKLEIIRDVLHNPTLKAILNERGDGGRVGSNLHHSRSSSRPSIAAAG